MTLAAANVWDVAAMATDVSPARRWIKNRTALARFFAVVGVVCFGGALPAASEPAAAFASLSLDDILKRDALTGDWGGRRKKLEDAGIKLGVQEQSELWGNLAGGFRQGVHYNGLAIPSANFDLEKLWGLKGGLIYTQFYEIHGRGPSATLVGNQQLLSNIEATPGFKLYMLYYEQQLFGDRLNVRIGQEGANDEMMLAPSAALFLNSSFGFPDHLAQNLPNGGPNYPLAVPMVRACLKVSDELTLVGSAFDGDPAGPGASDPQRRNATGTEFRLKDPVLGFGEVWYSYGQAENSKILAGTIKLGAWYHDGVFRDRSRDINGAPLAQTNGSGRPYRGDYAFYGIVDQMLWKQPGTKDGGITAFGLVMVGPDDRNRESAYVEGGFNWKGLFGRPNDIAGIAVAYAQTSDSLRRFGAESIAFTGAGKAYKPHETVIEATYYYQIAPWFSVQPDVQYVINPGASLDQVDPSGKTPTDSLTVGVRTRIDF